MGALPILIFLLLAYRHAHSPGGNNSSASAAAQAAADAANKAAQTGHPADIQKAADAAAHAANVSQHASDAAHNASHNPAPWPQAPARDLPPWPKGWKPMNPPTQAAVARAWQLLPVLWKRGNGATQVEQTSGEWLTYVAFLNGKQKSVAVYRPKVPPEAVHQQQQPVNNA